MAKKAIFIPSTALTSEYDAEPKKYGQAALDNIIDIKQSGYENCKMRSYIYKSVNNDYQTKVMYKDHIKGFIEPNVGAHYYVMTAYSTAYNWASTRVDLRKASCNRAGHRNGFISLSLLAEGTRMRQCDIGLIYTSVKGAPEGWYPVSWSRDLTITSSAVNIKPFGSPYNFTVSDTVGLKLDPNSIYDIEIEVEKGADGYDYVVGYIWAVNRSSGARASDPTAKITYRDIQGKFFSKSYAVPHIRFTRFMSLVPVDSTLTESYDCVDNSSLTGVMEKCRLNSTVTWNASKIAFAWSCQSENITDLRISTLSDPSLAADADQCTIKHQIKTHES